MKQDVMLFNYKDDEGNPAGGTVRGTGIRIDWQNGPLSIDGVRREPNGAFVEGVISAALGRLMHYQESKFACPENLMAINALEHALTVLQHRTADREARGVEGSHEL